MADTHYVSAMSIPGLERAMMPKLVHQTKKPKTKVTSNQPAMASQTTLVGKDAGAMLKDDDSLFKLDASHEHVPLFERIKKRLS